MKKKISAVVLAVLMILQFIPFVSVINPQTAYAANPQANFTDGNLKAAVANWLGVSVTQTVYQSDIIAKLDAQVAAGQSRSFNAINYNISDLTGMDVFNGTNLQYLELRQNHITSLTPISGINTLQYLNIDGNNVSTLAPISGFTNLRQLIADNNSGINISAVNTLTVLQELSLKNTGLTNITPLTGHPSLQQLTLDDNTGLTSLAPLSGVTTLQRLWFQQDTGITDLSPLAGLTNITDLSFDGSKAASIAALANMPNLANLEMSRTPVTDFTPLTNLTHLRIVGLAGTAITDLNVLKKSTDMMILELDDTAVSDLTPLAGMTSSMYQLAFMRAQVSDITPLAGMSTLAILWAGDNYIDFWSGANKTTYQALSGHISYGITTPEKRIAVSDAGGVLTNVNMIPGATKSVNQITQQTSNGTTWGASTEKWPATYFYSSSDPSVAYIDQPTMTLKAVANGTATITAKRGSAAATGFQSYSFNVTVATPTLSSITVTPNTASVLVNGTQQYTATANYSDGTTADVTATATWATGSTATATIDNAGLATGKALGSTSVTATWNGKTGNATINVVPPGLLSITVTPATATVAVADTKQYTATANFSDGSTQNVSNLATWLVQFPTMASFNATGLATGKAVGTTGVAAQWNGQIGFANLTVTAAAPTVTSITVTPATATINEGQTQQYQAVANFSNGTTQDITAVAAWTTGSATTATINNAGLATGVTAGATTVTATWGGKTGTANLTVQPVVSSITVTPSTATVNIGQTQQYTAVANYSNGTQQDVTATATWATASVANATINNAGLATGVTAGTTNVTATWGGKTGTASLTVVKTLQSISVSPGSATIQKGATQQYTATAHFSDSSTQDVTSVSTWSVSDPSVATIDASGLANGLKAGSINVSATWNGMTGTATLAVNVPVTPPVIIGGGGGGPAIIGFEITPATADIEIGDTKQYVAVAKYSDGNTLTVTNFSDWSVSDNSVAKINETGLADGLKVGSVTVSAKWSGRTATATLNVKDKPNGAITVHYVNQDGKSIVGDTQMANLALGSYPVTAKDVDGFRLLDQATVNVTISREALNQVVTFHYDAIKGSIKVLYKANDGQLLDESNFTNVPMGPQVVGAASFSGYDLDDVQSKTVTLTPVQPNVTVTFTYKKLPVPVAVVAEQNPVQQVPLQPVVPVKPKPVPVPKETPTPTPTPTPQPEIKYGKVYGIVHDMTGKPLANIQVEIHSDPQVTVTNEKGEYSFEKVELGNHTVILKDAKTLLELGRINVKVDDKQTIENQTQTSISLTDGEREKKVDFLLVLPAPAQQPKQTPVWPIPVAAGLIVAIILFLRRKNVEVYEGEKMVRKLRVKAKPETVADITRALPNGSSEEITVVFLKRIARRLQDRQIVITFKRGEVFRVNVENEPQRQPIEVTFKLPAADNKVVDIKKQA